MKWKTTYSVSKLQGVHSLAFSFVFTFIHSMRVAMLLNIDSIVLPRHFWSRDRSKAEVKEVSVYHRVG